MGTGTKSVGAQLPEKGYAAWAVAMVLSPAQIIYDWFLGAAPFDMLFLPLLVGFVVAAAAAKSSCAAGRSLYEPAPKVGLIRATGALLGLFASLRHVMPVMRFHFGRASKQRPAGVFPCARLW